MDCLPCSVGEYCGSEHLTAPTGDCSEGYFCRRYAESATPDQGNDAGVCPQGELHGGIHLFDSEM